MKPAVPAPKHHGGPATRSIGLLPCAPGGSTFRFAIRFKRRLIAKGRGWSRGQGRDALPSYVPPSSNRFKTRVTAGIANLGRIPAGTVLGTLVKHSAKSASRLFHSLVFPVLSLIVHVAKHSERIGQSVVKERHRLVNE